MPANTPLPSTSFPEKVPSYIFPIPHEGLLALSMAPSIGFPESSAIFRQLSLDMRAPRKNSSVTSLPSLLMILLPDFSAGGRGHGSPPALSGQTIIYSWVWQNRITSSFRLFPPSYLQLWPEQASAYYIHNYSFRVTTVTPSPPSSYFPFRKEATSLCFLNARRRPSLSIPSPRPWMTVTSLRPAM